MCAPRTLVMAIIGLFTLVATGKSWAWHFAEGYSAVDEKSVASIGSRAFTIYTGAEACAQSKVPDSFTVRPNPVSLTVGDRFYRDSETKLAVFAYDENGILLPAVPIYVSILADKATLDSRSDWDYFVGTAPGHAKLVVSWYCADDKPVSETVPIVVRAK